MELPPPHVLLQLDAIIVAQRESDGARVVATASTAATPPRPVSRWLGEVKERAPAPAPAAEQPKQKKKPGSKWTPGDAPEKRERFVKRRRVEGAEQKSNGKWACSSLFPGREFDDLDEYRAAKKQRAARRAAYSDQIPKKHRVRPEVVEAPQSAEEPDLVTV